MRATTAPRLSFPDPGGTVLHIVHMIQRRYPDRAPGVTRALLLASGSALLVGLGLLLVW